MYPELWCETHQVNNYEECGFCAIAEVEAEKAMFASGVTVPMSPSDSEELAEWLGIEY